MHPMAPIVHFISIGTNGYRHWHHFWSQLVTIGAMLMERMIPLYGDVKARITIKGRGAIGDNGDDFFNSDNGDSMVQ